MVEILVAGSGGCPEDGKAGGCACQLLLVMNGIRDTRPTSKVNQGMHAWGLIKVNPYKFVSCSHIPVGYRVS